MAIAGIGSAYGNVYESMYASSKKEATGKETAGTQKYSSVSEYYSYLKNKYPCLTDSQYKVTISPAFLEKCIKDPEKAELMEKSLAHLPVDHQNMTLFWNAQGAEVVNEQWIFDENGDCKGSTSMYVTSKNASSGSSAQDKVMKKKTDRKYLLQELYERRKQLREQFEERQAAKALFMEEFENELEEKKIRKKLQEKNTLSGEQNYG